MSLAERVRRALAELRVATVRQIADYLKVQTRAEVKRVSQAVESLADSGAIIPLALNYQGELVVPSQPRRYRLAPRASLDKQAIMWRHMCLRSQKGGVFPVAEVAMFARADYDYAKRFVGFLARQGVIVPTGKKGNAILYRVTPGQERSPAPRWNRRAEKRIRNTGWKACATGGQGAGEDKGLTSLGQILADMELIVAAVSGEALILKGFLLEMRAAVGAAAGGGHGAESGDQQ